MTFRKIVGPSWPLLIIGNALIWWYIYANIVFAAATLGPLGAIIIALSLFAILFMGVFIHLAWLWPLPKQRLTARALTAVTWTGWILLTFAGFLGVWFLYCATPYPLLVSGTLLILLGITALATFTAVKVSSRRKRLHAAMAETLEADSE